MYCGAVKSREIFGIHREENSKSHVLGSWSPVRSRSLGSRFFQAWRACERFFRFCWLFFGGDTICLLSSRLRPDPDKSYRTASLRHLLPDLAPVSAPRDTSRAVATLRPLLKRQDQLQLLVRVCRHAEDLLLPFFLHATLPVPALHTPHQQRPLPSTTSFSNSHRASARTDLASKLFGSINPVRCLASGFHRGEH